MNDFLKNPYYLNEESSNLIYFKSFRAVWGFSQLKQSKTNILTENENFNDSYRYHRASCMSSNWSNADSAHKRNCFERNFAI